MRDGGGFWTGTTTGRADSTGSLTGLIRTVLNAQPMRPARVAVDLDVHLSSRCSPTRPGIPERSGPAELRRPAFCKLNERIRLQACEDAARAREGAASATMNRSVCPDVSEVSGALRGDGDDS